MADRTFVKPPSMGGAIARLAMVRKHGSLDAVIPFFDVEIPSIRFERSVVDAYRRVCGLPQDDVVPIVYPQILAGALHAQLFLDPRFPLSPLGIVHRAQTINQEQPLTFDACYRIVGSVGETRVVDAGREIDLLTDVYVTETGERAWHSVATTIVLDRRRKTNEKRSSKTLELKPSMRSSAIYFDDAVGRRYARVSGDYNPIHIHPLLSRAFGYKRPIAHGLFLLARVLAELDVDNRGAGVRLSVQFRRPVLLPAHTFLHASDDGACASYVLLGAKKKDMPPVLHASGEIQRGTS